MQMLRNFHGELGEQDAAYLRWEPVLNAACAQAAGEGRMHIEMRGKHNPVRGEEPTNAASFLVTREPRLVSSLQELVITVALQRYLEAQILSGVHTTELAAQGFLAVGRLLGLECDDIRGLGFSLERTYGSTRVVKLQNQQLIQRLTVLVTGHRAASPLFQRYCEMALAFRVDELERAADMPEHRLLALVRRKAKRTGR